jgi:acetyl-CoA synthetase
MAWETIKKSVANLDAQPNLMNYKETYSTFQWDKTIEELEGLPGNAGLNIAYETVDRHAYSYRRNHLAIRWIGKDDSVRDFTYVDLMKLTNKFANVLRKLGIQKADRVCVLAGRIPELYIAALGTLKNISVFCPLFSAFGPEPIWQRLSRSEAKVLVTTTRLYERNVAHLTERLPDLKYIILTDADTDMSDMVLSWSRLMDKADDEFFIETTDPEDMAVLHFTSGTTGMPKGAIHVHNAIKIHYMTGKYALDMHRDDVFWCTADPGWVTGTSYGIFAPLVHGITNIIDEAEFNAERWFRILEEQKVTVWYTAPTAIRRLMRLDIDPLSQHDLSHVRFVASVGEPLNPEAVVWGREKLNLSIHDNWWQTETGGIMIANYASMDIRPGSMGKPLPGIEAAIVQRTEDDEDTHVEVITQPDVDGELALKSGWPSMFRGYLHEEERYRKCFIDGWYITGDRAERDADGYFWFIGRADDIIKTAGHMVGPFEVESALIEHPAVTEAAVIGKPDPMIGQIVKAFVSLKAGYEPTEELRLELIGFGRKRLGSAVAPKEIEFNDNLPKTRSGKIMRRLLKARELGLPEGDTSTLEID